MLFYFLLKAIFIPKILTFMAWLIGHVGKRLDKKAYNITGWKQIIAIHALSNISRRKNNQVMKFGQSIEYNVGNIFLEKSFKK